MISLPVELWIHIAQCVPCPLYSRLNLPHAVIGADEHMFNALVRAVPYLGRWTIAGHNGDIVGRRLDLMIMFGYSVILGRGSAVYPNILISRDDAAEYNTSYIVWRKNGITHRNDGPAITAVVPQSHTLNTGLSKYIWKYHGLEHRRDGPAIESTQHHLYWLLYDRFDRAAHDGPSVLTDKMVMWHSDDFDNGIARGPARIYDHGVLQWYENSTRHREGGPTIIYPSGELKYYNTVHYKSSMHGGLSS